MLQKVRTNKKAQLWIGLAIGVFFGFFLQRSGVTRYDTILNQLLLTDFTVVKVMLTAVIVGMLGVHLMRSLGWVRLQPKPGSVGVARYPASGDIERVWARWRPGSQDMPCSTIGQSDSGCDATTWAAART